MKASMICDAMDLVFAIQSMLNQQRQELSSSIYLKNLIKRRTRQKCVPALLGVRNKRRTASAAKGCSQ